ncbi:transposase [Natroniella sulfidigena]|uniref:RNA-guided endonuclease InsQ/TnpB family protein n=1 Tax=Natroniella sulfidigena TaxID=723921 RepID=UPI00200AF3EB|nr:transposase [Natroniella sulfidigena]MCK8817462.1 transposase [Natroniella sulfidigena]
MKLAHNYIYKPNKRQQIIIGCLSYASARLFNIGNYERHNWTKDSGEDYPNWYKQKKELKTNFWYKNLPSQSAQETLKILDKSWKSFYKLIDKYKKGDLEDKPKPPYYKPKDSKYNVRYLNNGFKFIDNKFRLSIPKQLKGYLQEKYSIDDKYIWLEIPKFLPINKDTKVKQMEFKPLKDNTYKVSIIVDIPNVEPIKDNGNYLSIDLGISNLMTCYDNCNENSFIISGKQWLSINRYFDKTISHYQSIANAQQNRNNKKPASTKRIKNLYRKRRRKLDHLLHAATKTIVDYCIENNISKVIVGDLKNVRKDTNFGKKTNQKIHKLPFAKIYKLLKYKLAKSGISITKQKEHYTSQCSPHSKKVTKKYAKRSNRKYRGLYVDEDYNSTYNADSVGAFNIMRKHLKRKLPIGNLSNPSTYKWIDNKFKIA